MTKDSSTKPANPGIPTINGGSSSIKFALFQAGDPLQRILEGGIERIGQSEATLRVDGSTQTEAASGDSMGSVGTSTLSAWQRQRTEGNSKDERTYYADQS